MKVLSRELSGEQHPTAWKTLQTRATSLSKTWAQIFKISTKFSYHCTEYVKFVIPSSYIQVSR